MENKSKVNTFLLIIIIFLLLSLISLSIYYILTQSDESEDSVKEEDSVVVQEDTIKEDTTEEEKEEEEQTYEYTREAVYVGEGSKISEEYEEYVYFSITDLEMSTTENIFIKDSGSNLVQGRHYMLSYNDLISEGAAAGSSYWIVDGPFSYSLVLE
jgi:uncharacterized protein YxeA